MSFASFIGRNLTRIALSSTGSSRHEPPRPSFRRRDRHRRATRGFVSRVRRSPSRSGRLGGSPRRAADAGGDVFAADFDRALVGSPADLAAGVEATALDRARPSFERPLVTAEDRVGSFTCSRRRL